jgi:uncharacterized delta-60 repeat protein
MKFKYLRSLINFKDQISLVLFFILLNLTTISCGIVKNVPFELSTEIEGNQSKFDQTKISKYITKLNQADFNLEGTCTGSNSPLQILTNSEDNKKSVHAETTCLNGLWKTPINLTPLPDGILLFAIYQSNSNDSQTNIKILKDTTPPSIDWEFLILNSSPTNTNHFGLNFVEYGNSSEFCILENSIEILNCQWKNLPLPTSFDVTSTNNLKTLSAWVKDSFGNISSRMDSNSVLLNTSTPNPPNLSLENPLSSTGNNSKPTILIRDLNIGDTVEIFDNDPTCTLQNKIKGKGTLATGTSLSIQTITLAEGSYSFYGKTTNKAESSSICTIIPIIYQYDFSAPAITNISTSTNGPFKINDLVNIKLNFSEAVFVTGVPELMLDTTRLGAKAIYSSGSGTNQLTFAYQVQNGDNTLDLTYSDINSLVLPLNSNIKDLALNSTNLLLPSPGSTASLSSNQQIVIDTLAPIISNFSVTNSNITSSKTFNLIFNASGSPSQYCLLENSTEIANCNWNPLPLPITFEVSSTNNSKILSAWVKDSANNVSTRMESKSVLLNTSIPTAPSLSLSIPSTSPSNILKPTFIATGVNDQDSVTLYANDSTCSITSNIKASGTVSNANSILLESSLLTEGSYSFYAKSTNTALTSSPCSLVPVIYQLDLTGPTILSLSSSSNGPFKSNDSFNLIINFSETVSVIGNPELLLNTTRMGAKAIYSSGSGTNQLTFTYQVQNGDNSSDLSYTDINSLILPQGSFIKDLALNNAILSLPAIGGTGSLSANQQILIDTMSPSITSVSSSKVNGTYSAGTDIDIQINFSENIFVDSSSGVPTLDLNTNPSRSATFLSGSGTQQLTFKYSIQNGDLANDLNYSSVNSLVLNNGLIKDSAGNNSIVTLPTDASGFSLGANKNLKIGNSPSPITLSNFQITSPTYNSFTANYDFTGDTNSDSSVKVYYCSNKTASACDPITSGVYTQLVRGSTSFSSVVNLSAGSFTPGDILKYQVVANDPDGVTSSPQSGLIIIPFNPTAPLTFTQFGYVNNGKGDASGSEMVAQMMRDSAGNLYVAGNTDGSFGEPNGGSTDIFVIKFNSSGVKQWIVQLGKITLGSKAISAESVNSIELDPAGNIYIGGQTGGSLGEANGGGTDVFIVKLNSSGSLQWISQVGSVTGGAGASSGEILRKITLDSSGNIYAGGITTGSLGETNGGGAAYDIFIIKFNSSGVKQWISQLGSVSGGAGASSHDQLSAIKIDPLGDIVVAGYTSGNLGETSTGGYDIFAAKFNSSGVKQWLTQLGSTSLGASAVSSTDSSGGMVVDSSGNIYIVGGTLSSLGETNGGLTDAYIVKFNSSGVRQWITQLGSVTMGAASSGNDSFSNLSLDSSSNIYAVGTTDSNLAETNAGSNDIIIVKFDSSGIKQWIKQLGKETLGTYIVSNDTALSIQIDASNNLYIGGYTNGILGETPGGNYDAYVAKFNSSGVKQWISQMGSVTMGYGFSGSDIISSIDVDSQGNLIVGGSTTSSISEPNGGGSGKDIFVAKFNPNGVKLWFTQLGYSTIGLGAAGSDNFVALKIDSSGNIIVGGNTSGALGETNGSVGNYDVFIAKFNSSGVKQWVSQLGAVTVGAGASAADNMTGLEVDSSGNIFIAGNTSGSLGEANAGSGDAFVAKFNSSGVKQWISQLGNVTIGAGASKDDQVRDFAIDASGNLYIGGDTAIGSLGEAAAGSYDVFVAKFNSSGLKQWVSQLGNVTIGAGAGSIDYFAKFKLDDLGNIYLTGFTAGDLVETKGGNYDVFVAKLNSSGVKQWVSQLGNVTMGTAALLDDRPNYIGLDTNKDIYVSGYTTGSLGEASGGGNDIFLAKFNNSGVKQWVTQLGSVTIGVGASGSESLTAPMVIDSNNSIFLVGYTNGDFGETKGGSNDAFIIKFNSSGTKQWIKQFGANTIGTGASYADYIYTYTFDALGNIFAAITTSGSMGDFYCGSNDMAITKLNSNGVFSP